MRCGFMVAGALLIATAFVGCKSDSPAPEAAIPPSITAQPVNQTVTEGEAATFTVGASGTAPLAYQWSRDGVPIADSTSQSYTTPPASLAANGASFSVLISNSAGAVTSASAMLSVLPIPFSFTASPSSLQAGETSTLSVSFSGPADGLFIDPGTVAVTASGQRIAVTPDRTTNYLLYRSSVPYTSDAVGLAAVTVAVAGTTTPPFTSGGRLAMARSGATATALADGTVLVAGGHDAFGARYIPTSELATAEIYDPVANEFRATAGDLTVARAFHTATRLANGQVLIVGGAQGTTSLAAAEIYDPATGRFAALPSGMTIARVHHRATILADGRVLVTGGLLNGMSLPGSEIYNPATRQFVSVVGAMQDSRCAHEAVLLGSGKVLVVGGWSSDPSPRSGGAATDPVTGFTGVVLQAGEVFDPATGRFTAIPAPTVVPRYRFASTRLPSGSVILWGSYEITGYFLETYDPLANRFDATVPLNSAWWDIPQGTATLLPNGKVALIGGEAKAGTGRASTVVAYQFDPARNTVIEAGTMIVGRHQHEAVLLDSGKILVVAGLHETHQPISQEYVNFPFVTELFDPANATHMRVDIQPATRAMYAGTTADFLASVPGSPSPSTVTWSVVEPAGGFAVPDAGNANLAHYTAPGNAGTWHLRATSTIDPGGYGTATVTVYEPGTITVTVVPGSVNLQPGGTISFTSTVQNAVNPAVTWQVLEPNGGVISTGGAYTAPSAPGTYHVVATSVDDPSRSGTALVNVN